MPRLRYEKVEVNGVHRLAWTIPTRRGSERDENKSDSEGDGVLLAPSYAILPRCVLLTRGFINLSSKRDERRTK